MIILGHKEIESIDLYEVNKIEDIQLSPSNSTVLIPFISKEIMDFARNNEIKFALHVKSLKELIFGHLFGASYLLVEKNICVNAQKIANEYLYDAKILVQIDDEIDIEKYALLGIDGVLFPQAIKKL
jgi:hypothetical protein